MGHWKKRETVFAEYGCTITLEGHWQLRPTDDTSQWIYRSTDRKEQLTISRLDTIGARDDAAMLRNALNRSRKALELALGREPEFTISDPEYLDQEQEPWSMEDDEWTYSYEDKKPTGPAARYYGHAGSEHLFYTALFVNNGEVWQAFYDAFKLTEETAQSHFEALIATVAFR